MTNSARADVGPGKRRPEGGRMRRRRAALGAGRLQDDDIEAGGICIALSGTGGEREELA